MLFKVLHTSEEDASEVHKLMLRQNIGKRISEAFMCVREDFDSGTENQIWLLLIKS